MSRAKRKPWNTGNPNETRLYAWAPDRRAGIAHIREAIQIAVAEKYLIGNKSDNWYAGACTESQRWRDQCRARSIKQLARQHLEYWRMRAYLGLSAPSQGSHCPAGFPWDRPANRKWFSFFKFA